MAEIKSEVLTQDQIDANIIIKDMGAQPGDTVTITRPDAPAGGTDGGSTDTGAQKSTDGGSTGTDGGAVSQDSTNGQGVAADPKEGDVCTTTDGAEGTLQAQGSKATGITLVCVPNAQ